jgi:hypothetical protein
LNKRIYFAWRGTVIPAAMASMPRFVILRHEMPLGSSRGTHFDLMLEVGGMLRTWSIPELPVSGKLIQAEALLDHRLAYLDYEGPVSDNRGSVSRVDEGEYEVLADSAELWHVRLAGKVLNGRLELRQAEDSPSQWMASFHV